MLGFERWRAQLEQSVTFIAIEVSSNSIVGFATVGKRRSLDDCSAEIKAALIRIDGELYAIYLLKQAQRQGVFSQYLIRLGRSA